MAQLKRLKPVLKTDLIHVILDTSRGEHLYNYRNDQTDEYREIWAHDRVSAKMKIRELYPTFDVRFYK